MFPCSGREQWYSCDRARELEQMRPVAIVFAFVGALAAAGCCDQIREDARALKAKHSRCGAGDTCVIASMYELVGGDNCLAAFQCDAALNEAGLDDFAAEAKDLADRFERCNECAQAGCAGMTGYEAFCDEEAGRCAARPIDGVDGGV